MTKTITLELTDAQYEKIQELEAKGISVGEAIEKLIEIQNAYETLGNAFVDSKMEEAIQNKAKLEKELEEADKKINLLNKFKDKTLEYEEKAEIIEKEFSNIGDTDFQDVVQQIKQNTKFKFLKF